VREVTPSGLSLQQMPREQYRFHHLFKK